MSSGNPRPVRELRLVVTATDYDVALRFYRDVLGLPEQAVQASPGGRVAILDAGRPRLRSPTPSTLNTSIGSRSGVGSPDTSGCASGSKTRPKRPTD
jgi:catechol 2,3-dioxygenase-like lactoylglutathione lyase family enzyme